MNSSLTEIFTEARSRLITVRDVLRFAISIFEREALFYGHGTTNSYDEAMYLLCFFLNLPAHLSAQQLEMVIDGKLLNSELSAILDILFKRINDKIPAAYLTNQAWCQGYSFYVDERVIIPRSFLAEIIVNDGLAPLIEHKELVNNVLDLCTGSGVLAIIAADYFYESNVVGADISDTALEVAAINVANYALEERVTLIQSDLFANLDQYHNHFDLIITNPPYVDDSVMANLTAEYIHEPNLALAGGSDGLDLVRQIVSRARHYLTEFGVLLVEMGDNANELIASFPGLPIAWLDTISGDGFVFTITKKELDQYFAK